MPNSKGGRVVDLCNAVFAYVGPEVLAPATSILAAVIGFLLMFGRALLRILVSAAH